MHDYGVKTKKKKSLLHTYTIDQEYALEGVSPRWSF